MYGVCIGMLQMGCLLQKGVLSAAPYGRRVAVIPNFIAAISNGCARNPFVSICECVCSCVCARNHIVPLTTLLDSNDMLTLRQHQTSSGDLRITHGARFTCDKSIITFTHAWLNSKYTCETIPSVRRNMANAFLPETFWW